MDFGSREILIALGILVVLGIVLDGLRRMRSGRAGSLRSSIRKQPIFEDDADERSSELPSGGARVVGYRDEEAANQLNNDIRSAAEERIHKVTAAFRELEQVPLGLDELDSEKEGLHEPELEDRTSETMELEVSAQEETKGGSQNTGADSVPSGTPDEETEGIQTVVLNLMAPRDSVFGGSDLLDTLKSEGLQPGEQGIFHQYSSQNKSGSISFSVANAINPGTFDFEAMDSFSTPGLTLFMVLNDSEKPLSVFDEMIRIAQSLADSLGGELKDEHRSTLTNQTLAHYRQQVVDYTRHLS